MVIKKGDFVEVEYTGTVKENGLVFDTTDEKLAKETGLYNEKTEYGPVIVCVGEQQLIQGLDDQVVGKEIGQEYVIELAPEQGFGKKDAKLIKMVPFRLFKKQGIMPEPGLQVNVDGLIGIIRTANGGRCLVDFNHPLSGKDIVYKIKLNKLVTDDSKNIQSYIKLSLNLSNDVEVKEGKAVVKTKKEIPKQLQEQLESQLKDLIRDVKEYVFVVEKDEKKHVSVDKKPQEN